MYLKSCCRIRVGTRHRTLNVETSLPPKVDQKPGARKGVRQKHIAIASLRFDWPGLRSSSHVQIYIYLQSPRLCRGKGNFSLKQLKSISCLTTVYIQVFLSRYRKSDMFAYHVSTKKSDWEKSMFNVDRSFHTSCGRQSASQ